MTMHRLIQSLSFDQDDIERLVAAYEEALRTLHISDRDDPINEVIAQRIVEGARAGVLDRMLYARWPSRTLWFRKVRLLNSTPQSLICLLRQFTPFDWPTHIGSNPSPPRCDVHPLSRVPRGYCPVQGIDALYALDGAFRQRHTPPEMTGISPLFLS